MKFPWIRTIAVLEIVGGVIGILFMIYSVVVSGFAFSAVIAGLVASAIFLLSMLAGSWLWQGLPRGRTASLVVQFIQLPKLVSDPLIFMFSFGLDAYVHFTILPGNYTTAGIQFPLLADGQLYFASHGAPFLLGISIPALIWIAKLWNYDPAGKDPGIQPPPPGPDVYFGDETAS